MPNALFADVMKLLPEIPDYTWRPFADADGAQMLTFEKACSLLDGHTKLRPLVEWQTIIQAEDVVVQSQVALNAAGDVAAAGWFDVADRVDSVHGFLVGRVHPDFRGQGIGTALLLWLEEQAKRELAQMANGRPQDVITLANATISGSDGQEEAYYYRGLAYLAQGTEGHALLDLRTAVELNPTFERAQAALLILEE